MSLGTLVLGFEDQIWFQTEPKTYFNKCNHKLPCFLAYVGFNIHFSFAIFARAPCNVHWLGLAQFCWWNWMAAFNRTVLRNFGPWLKNGALFWVLIKSEARAKVPPDPMLRWLWLLRQTLFCSAFASRAKQLMKLTLVRVCKDSVLVSFPSLLFHSKGSFLLDYDWLSKTS